MTPARSQGDCKATLQDIPMFTSCLATLFASSTSSYYPRQRALSAPSPCQKDIPPCQQDTNPLPAQGRCALEMASFLVLFRYCHIHLLLAQRMQGNKLAKVMASDCQGFSVLARTGDKASQSRCNERTRVNASRNTAEK